MKQLFRGLIPVCRKEALHIVRDPGTLFFALLIPMLQLFLFGFAVDTNIRQIATVVLDESHTQESRELVQRFEASDVFAVRGVVQSRDGCTMQSAAAGRAWACAFRRTTRAAFRTAIRPRCWCWWMGRILPLQRRR